ncbi:hypothetical protein DXG01_010636 [Tephrocybe rancida]|nr:hypothetical protein DXG01_010636 [Tephrocybe rancida]
MLSMRAGFMLFVAVGLVVTGVSAYDASDKNKSVVVQVVDRCAGCSGKYDTDFSPTAFKKLADESVGRMDLTWEWTDLPLGAVTGDGGGDGSPSEKRRSKPFGRRKPQDPAPTKLLGRGPSSVSSTRRAGAQPPKRRYLTEMERRKQAGGSPGGNFVGADVPDASFDRVH